MSGETDWEEIHYIYGKQFTIFVKKKNTKKPPKKKTNKQTQNRNKKQTNNRKITKQKRNQFQCALTRSFYYIIKLLLIL